MNQHLCEEHSEKLLLDLNTMLAEWREERTTNASAARRSSGMLGAAAALIVACTCGVAMPLSWSWSHQPWDARERLHRAPRAPTTMNFGCRACRERLQMHDCHASKFVSKKEVQQYCYAPMAGALRARVPTCALSA